MVLFLFLSHTLPTCILLPSCSRHTWPGPRSIITSALQLTALCPPAYCYQVAGISDQAQGLSDPGPPVITVVRYRTNLIVDLHYHPTCILISVKNRYQVETIIQGPYLFPPPVSRDPSLLHTALWQEHRAGWDQGPWSPSPAHQLTVELPSSILPYTIYGRLRPKPKVHSPSLLTNCIFPHDSIPDICYYKYPPNRNPLYIHPSISPVQNHVLLTSSWPWQNSRDDRCCQTIDGEM